MIVKINYKRQSQTYDKTLNLEKLISYVKKSFNDLPMNFTLIYQSSRGEMTYIESDADLLGLKYCCSDDSIVQLTVLRNPS